MPPLLAFVCKIGSEFRGRSAKWGGRTRLAGAGKEQRAGGEVEVACGGAFWAGIGGGGGPF